MAQLRLVMIQLSWLAPGEIAKLRKAGWKSTVFNHAPDPRPPYAKHIDIGEGNDCRSGRAPCLEENSHGDRDKARALANRAPAAIATIRTALPKPSWSRRLSTGLAVSSCPSSERGLMVAAHA
jgi:hypothetical protein